MKFLSLLVVLAGCDRAVFIGDEPLSASMPGQWGSSFEDPAFGDWRTADNANTRGRFYTSTGAQAQTTQEHVHSGQRAVKLVLATDGGSLRIAKFLREGVFTGTVSFDGWFYLPTNYRVDDYLNLIQFRGRTQSDGTGEDLSLWDVNLRTRNGMLVLEVYDHLRQRVIATPTPAPVPIAAWFNIATSLLPSTSAEGTFTVALDNALALQVTNVATVASSWLQCNIGALSPNVTPSPAVVFVDDVRLMSL